MADRKPFPPPPSLSRLTDRNGAPALVWAAWFGVVASWFQRTRVITADVDWPSIAGGASAYADITVAGAELGDFAVASVDPADRDLAITAHVSAADTVTVWLTNRSGGAIDLAAGTTRIRLEKAR